MKARTPPPTSTPNRLRFARPLLAGAVGACVLAASVPAAAQADLSPPLPDVLLLVDTSGSMEFTIEGTEPVCNPNQPSNQNDRSRWIELVEVLTGAVDKYSCESLGRGTPEFATAYKFGSDPPYDFQYPIPFHRPLSNGCGVAPGTPFDGSLNPFKYPKDPALGRKAVNYHLYNWGASCNTWAQQANDGVLDTFRLLIRFGLMTFDSSVEDGRGYVGSSVDFQSGREGLWSYYVDQPAVGQPSACHANPVPKQEVGARNNAAPPWEGRMINFGNPDDGARAYVQKNEQIQEVLLSTRPYGATPIAGMLQDAKDFLLNDKSTDPDPIGSPAPTGAKANFGPYQDPYRECGRDQAIILLTDGLPNMDLRPACEATTTEPKQQCPYPKAEDTTKSLREAGIPTYVVGFALDKVMQGNVETPCDEVDCTNVTIESPEALQACCALEKIAVEGGGHAFFANDRAALKSHIHAILSQNVNSTSRTQPVVANGDAGAGTLRFFSGFTPGRAGTADAPGRPWEGILDRQRWECVEDPNQGNIKVPKPQEVDGELGDKFVESVGKAGPANRLIYTFIGGADGDVTVKSRNTMRPLLKSDPQDGLGTYGAHLLARKSGAFATDMPTAALDIPAPSCVDQKGNALPVNQCPDFFLNWLLGNDNNGLTTYERCASPGLDCDLIGDIFHSTPQVVGAPTALTRDDSYARFAYQVGDRPTVLYTSSNDGFLHAFRTDLPNDDASPELWAFIPPATLPNLHTQYPFAHGFLLDGIPVVSDVVAVETSGLPVVFERTNEDAQMGTNTWRTVLVQSFGSEHPGYFALDVTNPVPDPNALGNLEKGGPRLLWQLTNDSAEKNLFGSGGGTPTITTLFYDPGDGAGPREIPVAILPGGRGGTALTTKGPTRTFTGSSFDPDFAPRQEVRMYDAAGAARSLTIVRLDTGEIVRTFRQSKADIPGPNSQLVNKVIEVEALDSPVTGQPVAYPGLVGSVADRVYVGDNDGRLWRLDVSSRNPSEWSMKLFFDLYPKQLDGTSSGLDFDDGQPLMTVPVLSVNEAGNVTIAVASGDQDALGSAPGQRNFVYSLTETFDPQTSAIRAELNWYKELKDETGPALGERVVGPLVLFDGFLYFASFTPATAGTPCVSGRSRVWGMHYLDPKTKETPGDGGVAAPDFPDQATPQSDRAIVFGVSVVQQPSCFDVEQEVGEAAFLGLGGRRVFSNVQAGRFQLVMHMGDTKSGSGSTSNTNSAVSSKTIDLEKPSNASTLTGWASVLE